MGLSFMSNEDLINTLLYEDESTTLDFKSEQYRFIKANDHEKAELLKDVIAFSNAWRRSDAYILIGVREVKGEKAIVEGITEHLDDAQIQEFIQYKVNKPIRFSYSTIEIEGKKVGLISIPVQERPFYLKKDFAHLKAHSVYLRRGSSTAIALPEEIAKMGSNHNIESQKSPVLQVFIVSGEHDEIRLDEKSYEREYPIIPDVDDFPLYGESYGSSFGGMYAPRVALNFKNENYYSEYAKYWQQKQQILGFKLEVENSGNSVARDVKVLLDLHGLPEGSEVFYMRDIPRAPQKEIELRGVDFASIHSKIIKDDLKIIKTHFGYQVSIKFGKVQTHESLKFDEYVCLKIPKTCKISIDVTIYSDDLEKPEKSNLEINVVSSNKYYSVNEIIELSESTN